MPLTRLLKTNEPLSDDDTDMVRQLLKRTENERLSMTMKRLLQFTNTVAEYPCTGLGRLPGYLRQLSQDPKRANQMRVIQATFAAIQRENITRTELDCRALLSPVRRFPSELLSEIFLHHCDDFWEQEDMSRSPLLFCWISKRWRSVAMSTSALWNRLDFDISRFHDVELCSFFISNSGSLPLDLSFSFSGFNPTLAPRIMDVSMPHLHRWKKFSFDGNFASTIPPVDVQIKASQLEDITFGQQPSSDEDPESAWRVSIIRAAATCLQRLTWLWPSTHEMTLLSSVLCPQLSSLTLGHGHGATVAEFFRLVHQYPLLQSCDIGLVPYDLSMELPLFHSNIQNLALRLDSLYFYEEGDDYEDVLNAALAGLSLPSLKELQIKALTREVMVDWPQDAFLAMLKRSQCSLKTLSFNGVGIPKDFDACFTHPGIRNLEKLWIQYGLPLADALFKYVVPNEVITALTWTEDHRLLPDLVNLGVCVDSDQGAALDNMVASRVEGKTFSLGLLLDKEDEDKSEMKDAVTRMQRRGIRVEIEYESLEAEEADSDSDESL
ncbi:hypothetical protein C8J56DRAFT_587509 [Mycena floridula]|nr:hypothetical protein C8J56DRAFT_587509 [Mycena floridula]